MGVGESSFYGEKITNQKEGGLVDTCHLVRHDKCQIERLLVVLLLYIDIDRWIIIWNRRISIFIYTRCICVLVKRCWRELLFLIVRIKNIGMEVWWIWFFYLISNKLGHFTLANTNQCALIVCIILFPFFLCSPQTLVRAIRYVLSDCYIYLSTHLSTLFHCCLNGLTMYHCNSMLPLKLNYILNSLFIKF